MRHLMLLAGSLLQFSCSLMKEAEKPERQVVFSYEALSAMEQKDIPRYVYVFPPLRSNNKGKPIEKLVAIPSPRGGIKDWETPSSVSMNLRKTISTSLTNLGYEVVSFEDLLSVKKPYSVLTVSTFYTLPEEVKNEAGLVTDRASLILVKGAFFDEKLDPKSKKEIIQVNASLKIPQDKIFPNALEKTMKETFVWFGDHSSGIKYLDLN